MVTVIVRGEGTRTKPVGVVQRLRELLPQTSSACLSPLLDDLVEPASTHPRDLHAHSDRKIISQLFAALPPRTIASEFGVDALMWAWGTGNFMFRDSVNAFLKTDPGFSWLLEPLYSNFVVHRPKDAHLDNLFTLRNIREQIRLVDLISGVPSFKSKPQSEGIYIEPFLTQNFPSENHSEWKQKQTEHGRINVFLNEPLALALFRYGVPVAVVGFVPDQDGTALKITQIQGIKPAPHRFDQNLLFGLDWTGILVRAVMQIASDFQISNLTIQGGQNNQWLDGGIHGDGHLKLVVALNHYDGTAQHFGFTQGTDGDWHLHLKTPALANPAST